MKSTKKERNDGVGRTVDNNATGRDKHISTSSRSAGTTGKRKKSSSIGNSSSKNSKNRNTTTKKKVKQPTTTKLKSAQKVYKNGYVKGGLVAFRVDGGGGEDRSKVSDGEPHLEQARQPMLNTNMILPNRIVNVMDSDEATRRAAFDKFHASRKNFIKAEEFAGKGKILQILKYENTEEHGNFQSGMQFTCREPETGLERLWTTSGSLQQLMLCNLFL